MNKLYKILLLVTFICSLSVLGLFAYLNVYQETNIQSIKLVGDRNSASFSRQQIQISFSLWSVSRESQKSQIASSINIDPVAKYSTSWVSNSLLLDFPTGLQSDTNYSLQIKDINKTQTYKFKTDTQKLDYLSKSQDGSEDKIMQTDTSFSFTKELFSYKNIAFFDANSDYVAAGIDDGNGIVTKLEIKSLSDGQVQEINSPNTIYRSLSLAFTSPELVFVSKNSATQASLVQKYDLQNNQTMTVNGPPSGYDLDTAKYSFSDNYLMYTDTIGNTFLQANTDSSDNSDSNTILLGKYDDLPQINLDETKLLLGQQNADGYYNYFMQDIQSRAQITGLRSTANTQYIDADLFNTQNKILFSSSAISSIFTNLNPAFSVGIKDLSQNSKDQIIFQDPAFSYELPKINSEDRYIVVEKSSIQSERNSRVVRNQGRSDINYLVIYDLAQSKTTDLGILGQDAVWL
jgi:hypothetical protein